MRISADATAYANAQNGDKQIRRMLATAFQAGMIHEARRARSLRNLVGDVADRDDEDGTPAALPQLALPRFGDVEYAEASS